MAWVIPSKSSPIRAHRPRRDLPVDLTSDRRGEENRDVDIQHSRQRFEVVDGDVRDSAFELRHVGPVKPSQLPKLLLT